MIDKPIDEVLELLTNLESCLRQADNLLLHVVAAHLDRAIHEVRACMN